MPAELLEWAGELQATIQNGLTYADDQFDRECYTAVREVFEHCRHPNRRAEFD